MYRKFCCENHRGRKRMINDIYLMFLVAHDDGMRLSYVLRPQMGLLFIPKMIYEYRESPSEMILTGKNQRSWGKICPSATVSSTNPTWTYTVTNPDLHHDRPATNCPSHLFLGFSSYSLSPIVFTFLQIHFPCKS
jgi:hypothetical protein